MRRALVVVSLLLFAACQPKASPEMLAQWQAGPVYTCCNIHYEHEDVVDANYQVGAVLPFGSSVTVEAVGADSVTFRASSGSKHTLYHRYGREQESASQYFHKILVDTDPHARFDSFPPKVQQAIKDARVERGMTREQVILSLGYPPTHRTASLESSTWTYWYNRWITFTVTFGDDGRVSAMGSGAPTQNLDLKEPPPTPTPKPAAKRRYR